MSRMDSAFSNAVLKMSRVASNRVCELWNLVKTSERHLSQSLSDMIPRFSVDVYAVDKEMCFVDMCYGGFRA